MQIDLGKDDHDHLISPENASRSRWRGSSCVDDWQPEPGCQSSVFLIRREASWLKQSNPIVVFILADNIGWGDFGVYGGTTTTPRIDALANAGIRFNNYNVEAQCTPTRSAIMTGRQSVRTGCYTVPLDPHWPYGLAPWEYTIRRGSFPDAGYATALYGKWHLGAVEGRLPTDQGFDEWWGYKDSAEEAGYTSYALYRELIKTTEWRVTQNLAGKKGSTVEAGARGSIWKPGPYWTS